MQLEPTTLAVKSVNGSKCSFNGKFPLSMVFVKKKNECGMAAKWILGNKKKDGAGKRHPKQNGAKKHSEYITGIRLKICRRAKNYGAIRQAG